MKKLIAVLLIGIFLLSGCNFGDNNQTQAESKVKGIDYDVIIIGGEPEGVAAAVSAARNGLKTLLIEDDAALGGLMTLGGLNFIDMCEGNDGTLLTRGIFEEFHDAVGGTAFDIEKAKHVFLQMVQQEVNIDLKLNTTPIALLLEENEVRGVWVKDETGEKKYSASVVIDATADADMAAGAGVPYTFAGEDIGEKDRQMGVTLVFTLRGVDWKKVTNYLENDNNAGTGATSKSAWGYSQEGYAYEPQDKMMRLRGVNGARLDNGDVLCNMLIIFGVDVLDETSRLEGIARGTKELEYIVPYMREHFVGFENAELVGTAEQLYVRESRHIIGEYQLTIDDVLESRDQWDKIAIGGYPVDVQPTATQTYGTVIGHPDRYAVPYRCLVPLEVENLLVVGRSASYKSLAAGSARVIPLGMACGEAAGVAAAYTINHNMSVRDLCSDKEGIENVQKTLQKQGAYLKDFHITPSFMEHWAYDGVKVLRSLGLLDGGYNNEYGLDKVLGKWKYQNMLNGLLKKIEILHPYISEQKGIAVDRVYYEVNEEPTVKEVIITTAKAAGFTGSYDESFAWLQEKGILTAELEEYFSDESANPLVAETVMLLANLYLYYQAM